MSFFKKDLQSIIAPLEKIHNRLEEFMDRVGMDISNNLVQISNLQIENEFKRNEQETANKIKTNLINLLGK